MPYPTDPEPGVLQERTVLDLSGFPLRYVTDDGWCSIYRDRDGDEVHLQHGTGRRLVPNIEVHLPTMWVEWQRSGLGPSFLDWLKERVTDPDDLDWQVAFCGRCSNPLWEDESCSTAVDGAICESCDDDYFVCGCCEERWHDGVARSTYHDETVCERCIDRSYYYCEACDDYVHCDAEHYHDEDEDDCGCESPATAFTIRNDGHEPLANDTRVTVRLPAGIISDEGIGQIATLIQRHYYNLRAAEIEKGERDVPNINADLAPWWTLAFDLRLIGEKWQTKEGNFTKRLSRHAYKAHGLKVPPTLISEIGNIASAHSQAADLLLETTRELNQAPEDFYHEDSCWWGSYSSSRCALKTNGGFGLRSFKESVYTYPNGETSSVDEVTGRAWVIPLKRVPDTEAGVVPTFETQDADAYVVFNGYGDLSGYAPARLLAQMVGMTYRKVGLSAQPMYVNGDAGYLVAPEEVAEHYTDGRLGLSVSQHADLYETEQSESKEMANA